MNSNRLVDKTTAFEMSEYLVAHTVVRKGFNAASFILLSQTAAMLGATVAWKLGHMNEGLLLAFLGPYVTGLIFFGAAMFKRYGIGGMWDKRNAFERHALNTLFEEMHEWQKQRQAREAALAKEVQS